MRSVLAAAVVSFVLATTGVHAVVRADEPSIEDVFRTTAAADRSRYAVGRDFLLAHGDAAVDVARRHVDDADLGVRALARYLVVRHDRVADCARWAPWLRRQGVEVEVVPTEAPARSVAVRLKYGGPETSATEFTDAAVPLLVDALRDVEDIAHPSAPEVPVLLAGALRAAEAAPWLARLFTPPSFGRPDVADALVAIGEPSIAPVRAQLDSDPQWSAAAAALVLSRLGDHESVPRLVDYVTHSGSRELVRACAQALGRLDPEAGALATVARLKSFDAAEVRRTGGNLDYADLRDAILGFGSTAMEEVSRRLATAPAPSTRARLEGIRSELAAPEQAVAFYASIGAEDPFFRRDFGKERRSAEEIARDGRREYWASFGNGPSRDDAPISFLLERAAAIGTERDLVRAVRAGTPLAVDVVRAELLASWRPNGGAAEALVALAETAPDAALDVLDAWTGGEPPSDLGRAAESLLLLLDRPRAVSIVDRIVRRAIDPRGKPVDAGTPFGAAAQVALAARAVLRGERRMAELLTDPSAGVRLAVARALARRGDPAGVPVLAAAAIEVHGVEYAALRDDLVRAGRAPEASGDDVRMRVLAAAVAARIADPAAAAAYGEARRRREPFTMSHAGLRPADFEAAGAKLSKDVGPPARALLEESALLLVDEVAIYALGTLGDERSIPVLVQAARFRHDAAATALRAMGPKGLDAARAIPPPDPAKPAYGERASRHLGAAEALADAPDAAEKALAGLAEKRPDGRDERYAWSERMRGYLSIAGRTADPRIVESVLAILSGSADDHELADAALEALEKVRDPRVPDACIPWLPAGEFDQHHPSWGPALRVLVAQTGDGFWAFVRSRLGEAQTPRARLALAHAMFSMAFAPTRTASERAEAAAALRELVRSDDAEIARSAAHDLARLQIGRAAAERDAADDAALLSFLRTHGDPGLAAEEILKLRIPGSAEALLDCYRIARDFRALGSLGALAYEPAVPDVLAGLRLRLSEKSWTRDHFAPREMHVLPQLGVAGRDAIRELAASADKEDVRAIAIGALAEAGDATMFGPVVTLLDAADAKGAGDYNAQQRRTGLIWLLIGLDTPRAHTELVRRSLASSDAALARAYASAVLELRRRHPELRDAPPSAGPK